jgi:hypothetical protein
VHEPLTRDDLVQKFRGNISYGGWDEARGEELLDFCLSLDGSSDVAGLKEFRA